MVVQAQRSIGVAVFLLNVDSVDLSAGTVNMDLLLYTRDENNKPYFNDTLRLGNTYRLSRADALRNYYRIQATFTFRPATQEYPADKQRLREWLAILVPSSSKLNIRVTEFVVESEQYDSTQQVYYELAQVS